MNRSATIEVIVLSYNRPENLRLALTSIRNQSHQPWRITVVDNASPNSAEIAGVVTGFDGVRLLKNENIGYAGGMNRGLREAEGDFVYLTEDDVVLEPHVLSLLADYAVAQGEAGAGLVGAVICDHDEPERTICAGGEFELGNRFRLTFHTPPSPANGGRFEPHTVGFLPGNSILARRDWLRSMSGFREEFFMYLEDLELCARAREAGANIAVVPRARVRHIGFQANSTPQINFHRLKNLNATYLLHAPPLVLPVFVLRYVIAAHLRALLRHQGEARAHWQALGWTLRNGPRLWRERRNWKRRLSKG